jgi:Carboxypeptidase regulatory-like domain
MKTFSLILIFICVTISSAFAGDANTCNISFTVIRDYNGKPVRNASIVLHPVDKNGKQRANGVELKADNEGKASFTSLPYGKIRVQVLAPGLQTFGEDYDIREKNKEIEIKLKKPQSQYSIYDDKDKKTDKDKDQNKDPKK